MTVTDLSSSNITKSIADQTIQNFQSLADSSPIPEASERDALFEKAIPVLKLVSKCVPDLSTILTQKKERKQKSET